MNRMTITIDEELVNQAKEILGTSTKVEAIRLALMEVLRKKRLAEVLTHQGQIELDLDQEKLQKLRDQR